MAWSSYFWVRSAGFPFDCLDHFGVLAQSSALERYEALLVELNRLERRIIAVAQAYAPGTVGKLERKFRERSAVKVSELGQEIRRDAAPLLDARDVALAQMNDCEPSLRIDFQIELQRARQSLVDFLAMPDAREALFLSNPEALQRIDALIERGIEQIDSRARQRLRLGWNYVQRLCAKNDTSSFFGPIAWGKFVGEDKADINLELCATPWLSSRKTFFEHWVVLRLALAVSVDPGLRDSLPITLSEGCHVENGVLKYPIGKAQKLDALGAAMLDGFTDMHKPGLSCATTVARLAAQGFAQRDVVALLEFLLAKKVLIAGFSIPPGSDRPLERFGQRLSDLDVPTDIKAPWLALLSNLEAQRVNFEKGGLEERAVALDAIRALLTDAGVDLSRTHGQMYVGRFPLYEDCSRNLHVELGGRLAQTLKTELEPIMGLYRWLVSAVAVRLHDRYLACWLKLQASGPDAAGVDFLSFFSLLTTQDHREVVIGEIRDILRNCWGQITAQHKGQVEVALAGADLDRLLQLLNNSESRAECFQVLGKDIHSPDFMLAARNLEAVERGDYQIVIGEVHPAVHTVSQPVAQPFCPYAEEIRQEVQDLLAPRTLVIADSPETYQRSHIDWLDVPALMQVVLPKGGGHVAFERTLLSGRGEVILKSGVLTFRDKRYDIEQDLLTVLPSEMHRICFALAGELIGHSESRRLKIGRIILKRQSWYMTGDTLPVGVEPGENLGGYLAWRRWAVQMGLPRHVFVKCESEPKPIYVDFCNPLALDLLAGLAKKKEPMRFSEMRPAPDELWLEDDRGRYCTEFRTSYVGARVPAAAPMPQQNQTVIEETETYTVALQA